MQPRPTAEDVAYFFSHHLRHIEGEWRGQPFVLQGWQYRDIIRPIFGTIGPDGYRLFRKSYVFIPRKNGKSTLAAGIALYLLFCDGEPGAQVISAASNLSQARICFRMAKQMVEMSGALRDRCTIYKDAIETFDGSVYHAISKAADTKDGLNCHGIIFDEHHAQKNPDLANVLESSTGARRQPLTFQISTAGQSRQGYGFAEYQHALAISKGVIEDPTYHVVLYGADENDDWTKEETWAKANPGYGVTCKPKYFENAVREAKTDRQKEENFRRKNLCQWTEAAKGWLPLEVWDQCAGEIPDLTGCECIAGLDLSSTQDLTALVLSFQVDGKFYLLAFAWAPRGAIEAREKNNKYSFRSWAEKGFLKITEGEAIDEDEIFADIAKLAEKYRIKEIRIDRFNAGYMSQRLAKCGIKVFLFGQGFVSMGPAIRDFEILLIEKLIVHDGHPVLRWCFLNSSVLMDPAGFKKFDKERSSDKIDLTIAATMAVSGSRVESAKGASVYETRGLLTV